MELGAIDLLERESRASDTLKVLSYNCFLLPYALTFNPLFWKCARQEERAQQIANIAKNADVCMLQEVWGPGCTELHQTLYVSHEVNQVNVLTPPAPAGGFASLFQGVKDAVELYQKGTGGLFGAWRRHVCRLISYEKRDFASGNPLSNQGVSSTLLDVSSRWPGCRLLTLNVHTSVMSAEARGENLLTIRNLLMDVVWREYLNDGAEQLSKTGVMLCGDFNIDPHLQPALYSWLVTLGTRAEVRDLFLPEHNALHAQRRPGSAPAAGGKAGGALHPSLAGMGATLEGPYVDEDGAEAGNSLCKYENVKARLDYTLAVDSLFFSNQDLSRLMGEVVDPANPLKHVIPPGTAVNGSKDFADVTDEDRARAQAEDEKWLREFAAQALKKVSIELAKQARVIWRQGGGLRVKFLPLECRGATVIKQPTGKELSDHWGLSTTVGLPQDVMDRIQLAKRMGGGFGEAPEATAAEVFNMAAQKSYLKNNTRRSVSKSTGRERKGNDGLFNLPPSRAGGGDESSQGSSSEDETEPRLESGQTTAASGPGGKKAPKGGWVPPHMRR